MCFGNSGSSKPPKAQAPTTFDYSNQSASTEARQAALYESKGYTNTASFGSELAMGGSQPAPTATPKAVPTTTGGA